MRASAIRPGPGSKDDVKRVQLTDRPLDPWTLELRFMDGVPVGVELVLPRGAQPVELDPALLTRLQAHWEAYLGFARHVLEGEDTELVRATVGRGVATASGGNVTAGDQKADFYEGIAAEYRQAVAAGKRPGKEIAEAYGASRSTVSNWLSAARKRGLLESPGHGRTGG